MSRRLGAVAMAAVGACFMALPVLAPAPARADDDGRPDLMNIPVTVTTRRERALRDAPGVVTVLTREDIEASGARDLVDLLLQVPGLQFGADVEGGLGPSVRGLWGTEGKVLLLVDGLEMNERLYGTNQFGMAVPIDLIERIEIMRGPGSVIYGGFAELAVIQITTVRPSTLRGLELHGTGGLMEDRLGQLGGAAAYGQAYSDDLEVSVAAAGGYAAQSDHAYRDLHGVAAGAGDNTSHPQWANVGLRLGDLSARFLYDGYAHTSRDGYGDTLSRPAELSFRGYFTEVSYALRPAPGLVLRPRASFKRQAPWRSTDFDLPTFYDKTADRYVGALTAEFDGVESLDLLGGVEVSLDRGALQDDRLAGTQRLFGRERTLSIVNGAGYVQGAYTSPLVTVVGGLRAELSDRYPASLVPRLGLLRTFDRFYVKGLATRAFRTPALENIGLQGTPTADAPERIADPKVHPEHTTIVELEGGYQVPYLMALSVNLFDMRMTDPIVFTYDTALGEEVYRNRPGTATRGLEAVARAMGDWGQLEVSYSTYTAHGANHVPAYAVPGSEDKLLGAARHKVALMARFALPGRFVLAPSAVFLSERARVVGHEPPPADGGRPAPIVADEPAGGRLNVFLNWSPASVEGLHVGLGVFDLFDTDLRYPQPHDSGHAPLPGPGREVLLKLGYALPLGAEAP